MATGNTAFGTDGLIATTLQNYRKKLEDQVFEATVLLYVLKKKGIPSQTGRTIVQPLLYAGVNAHGSYEDDDTFVAPTRQGITAAEYPWKGQYASIFFTGIEMEQNSGPQAALSLAQARVKQAELTVTDDLNAALFGDGTGNGGKDFMGLQGVIATGNTYGGIDRTDAANAWWRSQITTTAAALGLATMRRVYNNASKGKEQPTHLITTQVIFEAYEALLEDSVRHESTELGDRGFQSLKFKGAPIVFDRDVPTGFLYFLNLNHLELVKLGDRWFEWSDWLVPVNQDAKYKNLLLNGNLTTTNASLQGLWSGITNT